MLRNKRVIEFNIGKVCFHTTMDDFFNHKTVHLYLSMTTGVRIIENGGHIRRGINYIGRSRKEVRPRHCRCNQGWIAAQKINNGRKNVIKVIFHIFYTYNSY